MKKIVKRLLPLMLLALVAPMMMGCLPPTGDSIAVDGTWNLTTAYGVEQWKITENSVEYLGGASFDALSTYYKADIVKYNNDDLNGGDSSITVGGTDADVGYAVIRFTEAANVGWGTVGKYQIFRWGTNADDSAKRDFSQGSKDANLDGDDDPMTGTFTNIVFDTIETAEAGATNSSGHFGWPSAGAIKQ